MHPEAVGQHCFINKKKMDLDFAYMIKDAALAEREIKYNQLESDSLLVFKFTLRKLYAYDGTFQ